MLGVQNRKKIIFNRVKHLQQREEMKFELISQCSNERNWHVLFESFLVELVEIHLKNGISAIAFVYIWAPGKLQWFIETPAASIIKHRCRKKDLYNELCAYEIGMNHRHIVLDHCVLLSNDTDSQLSAARQTKS